MLSYYYYAIKNNPGQGKLQMKTEVNTKENEQIINNLQGISFDIYKDFSNIVDLKTRIEMLKVDPNLIDDILNPTEDEIITAIDADPYAVLYVKKPSQKIIHHAIKKDESIFYYFSDIDLKSKYLLEIIKNNPSFIKNIKNPNEHMQTVAVKKCPSCIAYFSFPSKKIQMIAVSVDAKSIISIHKPCLNIQKQAVKTFIKGLKVLKEEKKDEQQKEYLKRIYNNRIDNYISSIFSLLKIQNKKLLTQLRKCEDFVDVIKASPHLMTYKKINKFIQYK